MSRYAPQFLQAAVYCLATLMTRYVGHVAVHAVVFRLAPMWLSSIIVHMAEPAVARHLSTTAISSSCCCADLTLTGAALTVAQILLVCHW